MKILLISSVVIILLGLGSQVFFMLYDSKIETHTYQVIDRQGSIEIRKYDPALFISINEREGMFDDQNQAFRKLAAYIFGSNNTNEKISMTAPVQMQESDNSTVMKFMVPSKYKLAELPSPQNEDIKFNEETEYYAAVIKFGGYYDQNKFVKYSDRLKDFILKNGLVPISGYSLLGYNAPYQWFNRRNEVLVKIEAPSVYQN